MKILYFGPITPEGKPSIGGYEAANRKNIDALRKRGIEVVEFPNPRINHKFGQLGKLAYIQLYLLPFKLWKYRKERDVILHMTPLYAHLLLPSLFTMRIAKMLGISVLVDIRAGALITCWKHKTFIFRRHLVELLRKANRITVEGSAYINQIRDIIGIDKTAVYFPNIADCSHLPEVDKPNGTLNIFYFGRITEAKGIGIMLDTIKLLDNRFRLYLAGPFGFDYSLEKIKHERVEYLGFLTPAQLQETMKKMHFFIFPTRHAGEGQSNSLIEAMSNGLIPVVSDQGFNAEVVADNGRVLSQGSTGEDYAKAIMELSGGDLHAKAVRCQRHIKEAHNMDIEIPKLIGIYKEILQQFKFRKFVLSGVKELRS